MAAPTLLMPGDILPVDRIPQTKKGTSTTLALGPGLHYKPPATICAAAPGLLASDSRKNAVWLEENGDGRYVPATGDLVLATVHHSSVDYYHVVLSSYTAHASLPQLSFEGATKKTRPMLQAGSLVYARVSLANKHMEPEVECVHPSTGKSEGLGELKGGMLFEISLGMARRLMMTKTKEDGGVGILEDLAGGGQRFEVAIGRNGRLWVSSGITRTTLMVGRAVQQVDSERLNLAQQAKLARKLLKAG